MKALSTSFNIRHGLNPMVGRLLDAIPGFEKAGPDNCDVVFLSFIAPQFEFIADLDTLQKIVARKVPVIIFDHSETFPEDFFIGCNLLAGNYQPLCEALLNLEIKAYFKRELTPKAATIVELPFQVHTLDWTVSNFPGFHTDTVEEFNARPIDIFFSWGYSSESRPRLYGELMRQAGKFSAHFCLSEEDVDIALAEKRERIFALLFTPHYRRIPLGKILDWQQKAKISISMFGAGKKCFRCAEASYNCVMGQQGPDEVQWSYPWIPGTNCLQLPFGQRFLQDKYYDEETIGVNWLYQALREEQGKLHPIYLKGMENNRNYHTEFYAREYLLPKIQKALA